MRTQSLNEIMECDTVVEIGEDGSVTVRSDIYAPSVLDGEIDSSGWEFVSGYSGQQGYSGPIMHDSEFIGGGMERDLLESPGIYVCVGAAYSPEDEDGNHIEDGEIEYEGWALLRKI